MGWLRRLFQGAPRPIVLTGTLVEPRPNQVLVLTTPQPLTPEQREAARNALIETIGSMHRVFVISGNASLRAEDGDEGRKNAEGSDDEA